MTFTELFPKPSRARNTEVVCAYHDLSRTLARILHRGGRWQVLDVDHKRGEYTVEVFWPEGTSPRTEAENATLRQPEAIAGHGRFTPHPDF